MEVLYLVLFFILGLFMGSFFGVVGIRTARGENFVTGRSKCDICKHPLTALDMFPLFSFIFLKGRCRYCKNKINPLLFFVELFSGLLFMISYYSFGFSCELLLALGIVSLLMIVVISDFTYYIISDGILIFFAVYFLIIQGLIGGIEQVLSSLLSGVALFIFMYVLMCLGNVLFKRESLGGGDVKLLFALGLLLDPFLGMISIFLGSFIALPISILVYMKTKEHVIPFGPFLIIGFLILFFTKLTTADVLNFLLTFTT